MADVVVQLTVMCMISHVWISHVCVYNEWVKVFLSSRQGNRWRHL